MPDAKYITIECDEFGTAHRAEFLVDEADGTIQLTTHQPSSPLPSWRAVPGTSHIVRINKDDARKLFNLLGVWLHA